MRILSWNVNGIRAAARKGFLEWLRRETPDILCVQETKARPEQLPDELRSPPGYHSHWNWPAARKGYSGVAIFSRVEPSRVDRGFGIPEFDSEGRTLVAHYPDFVLVTCYFPNGQRDAERLRYKMGFYECFLDFCRRLRSQGKNLVMCGDYNTAHTELDIAHPKENATVSGFLPEERAWIDRYIAAGYADTFRLFCSDGGRYTWWDPISRARERNVGWRLDYFFVNNEIKARVQDAFILADVPGSDHCPVGIGLRA